MSRGDGGARRPYLRGPLRAAFDQWLSRAAARFEQTLRFQEIRQGVRSLSFLYVQRRMPDLATRSREGAAKRAALATYYAPLHFLAAWYALEEIGQDRLAPIRRVVDLGCGTGASGAAVSWAPPDHRKLLAIDRSGWALGEARATYAAFGLRARTVRRHLPSGLPRLGAGDLVVAGWMLNELGGEERRKLVGSLAGAGERGAAVLVLEPLSGRTVPWWDAAASQLDSPRALELEVKRAVERPERIAALDEAAGLDHRVIGARVWFAPGIEG